MNTKELIAAEIAKVVPELEQENIQNLLEIPKNADMGDLLSCLLIGKSLAQGSSNDCSRHR